MNDKIISECLDRVADYGSCLESLCESGASNFEKLLELKTLRDNISRELNNFSAATGYMWEDSLEEEPLSEEEIIYSDIQHVGKLRIIDEDECELNLSKRVITLGE